MVDFKVYSRVNEFKVVGADDGVEGVSTLFVGAVTAQELTAEVDRNFLNNGGAVIVSEGR